MKSNLLFLIFYAVLLSCNNGGGGESTDKSLNDSAKIQDSILKGNAPKRTEVTDEDTEDLRSILSDYVQQYNNPYVVDSSYIMEKDTIKVSLKHYCLMDSAITIPKKYVGMYKLDSLVTHNFITLLRVEKNGKEVVNRKIQKEDFEKYLEPSLQNYAVLFSPIVKKGESFIVLNYSISIPLTDVGIGVRSVINQDGTVSFEKR